jgi:hypothetical protein
MNWTQRGINDIWLTIKHIVNKHIRLYVDINWGYLFKRKINL